MGFVFYSHSDMVWRSRLLCLLDLAAFNSALASHTKYNSAIALLKGFNRKIKVKGNL